MKIQLQPMSGWTRAAGSGISAGLMSRFRRIHALPLLAASVLRASLCNGADTADVPLDTVVVTGTREAVRQQIQTFVTTVTRKDGDLIGRWRNAICPKVVGLTDTQSQFVERRLIEVHDLVRKRDTNTAKRCTPNLFVIVTDDAEGVLSSWRERDPGMFRWKTRAGVSHSEGSGAVRTWHNAIVEASDGGPTTGGGGNLPRGRLKDSRIQASAAENITAVVVLVDTRATGHVTLAQIADYIAMVSLSQLDLTAPVRGVSSILTLFGQPPPEEQPAALTAWDYAFLEGLYRTSYSPMHQRADIMARMTRKLAPR